VRRYQGETEIPLNDTGRAQAEKIREGLADVVFDRVISSPRKRAVKTAMIITGLSENEIEKNQSLTEASLGDWEARYEEAIASELGEAYDVWKSYAGLIAPPNGESLFHVMARLYEFVEEWLEDARKKNILVIAHQGTNAAILMLITGRVSREAAKEFRRKNAQVDIIDANTRKIVETRAFDTKVSPESERVTLFDESGQPQGQVEDTVAE